MQAACRHSNVARLEPGLPLAIVLRRLKAGTYDSPQITSVLYLELHRTAFHLHLLSRFAGTGSARSRTAARSSRLRGSRAAGLRNEAIIRARTQILGPAKSHAADRGRRF